MARLQVMQTKSHLKEELLHERHEQRKNAKKPHLPRVTATMTGFDEEVGPAGRQEQEDEEMVYAPAIVVEKPLVLLARLNVARAPNNENDRNNRVNNNSSNSSSSSSSSSSTVGGGSGRNMKRFKKNFVRVVGAEEVMTARTMGKVLPKESERELQLRLEYESVVAREEKAELMFADRFNMTQRKR